MPPDQRYVSEELTHFVGKHLPEERQFELLVDILRSGWLTHPPHDPDVHGNLLIDRSARISGNAMYEPQTVCFCDIPTQDIHIHLRKYSRFGIAFLKSLLVGKGANPVFYIAKNSRVAPGGGAIVDSAGGARLRRLAASAAEVARGRETRSDRFDDLVQEYHELQDDLAKLLEEQGLTGSPIAERLARLDRFLNFDVFSFCKFFEAGKPDSDPENFYMEREWRILGNVRFDLSDVRRVYLPEAYAERFRREVPDYIGQVTFV